MNTVLQYGRVVLLNCQTRDFSCRVHYDTSGTDKVALDISLAVAGWYSPENHQAWEQAVQENKSLARLVPTIEVTGAVQIPGTPAWLPKFGRSAPQHFHWLLRSFVPRQELVYCIYHPELAGSSEEMEPVLVIVPRGQFRGTILNNDTFPVLADIANGPKPKDVMVERVVGNSLRVALRIDATCILDWNQAGPRSDEWDNYAQFLQWLRGGGELSNRWSISETMDENWWIHRNIRGRITVAGTLHAQPGVVAPRQSWNVPPQLRRYLAWPPLERGFKRQGFLFHATEDGLVAEYTIDDVQIHEAAPWPATNLVGSTTFALDPRGGPVSALWTADFTVQGPPHVDRRLLIQVAMTVIEALSLNFQQINEAKTNVYLESCTIRCLYGPRQDVNVQMTLRLQPGATDKDEVMGEWYSNLRDKWLGKPLEITHWKLFGGIEGKYDRTQSFLPNPYGYDVARQGRNEQRLAVLALLSCYLQWPGGPHYFEWPTPPPPDTTPPPNPAPPDYPVQESPEPLPQANHSYYQSSDASVYTFYAMSCRHQKDERIVPLPLVASPASSAKPPTVRMIRMGQPAAQLIVEFDAERVGQKPAIPLPKTFSLAQDNQAVLLDEDIQYHAPYPTPDGRNLAYKISGRLVFHLTRPVGDDETIDFGRLPYTRISRSERSTRRSEIADASLLDLSAGEQPA
jgi:hypothetical protein